MAADLSKEALRRNPVAEWLSVGFQFVRANRTVVLILVGAFLVASLGVAGYEFYRNRQESEARAAIIAAMAKLRPEKPGGSINKDEAMKVLQEVASQHGGTVAAQEALIRVGNWQFEAQRLDDALATFSAYLKQYPRGQYRVVAAISKAYTEEAKGKLDDAVQTLTEITTTQKDDPLTGEALVSLGRLYEAHKKADEATKTYGQVAERYPNTSWAMQAQQRLTGMRRK